MLSISKLYIYVKLSLYWGVTRNNFSSLVYENEYITILVVTDEEMPSVLKFNTSLNLTYVLNGVYLVLMIFWICILIFRRCQERNPLNVPRLFMCCSHWTVCFLRHVFVARVTHYTTLANNTPAQEFSWSFLATAYTLQRSGMRITVGNVATSRPDPVKFSSSIVLYPIQGKLWCRVFDTFVFMSGTIITSYIYGLRFLIQIRLGCFTSQKLRTGEINVLFLLCIKILWSMRGCNSD